MLPFSYSSLGSITAMSTSTATTTYTYAGTNYANPHAATTIAGYTLTYDNNGNLISYGPVSYTWDYRNRLMNTGAGIATSTYGYDYQNNRVAQIASGITTIYINKLYSTNTASTTKHIFAGNDLIAVVERTGTATTTHIVHTDHLGGTNAITDADGDVVQALDYYPYGERRIDTKTESFDERRKYTGHEYDLSTGLNYMMARYQDPNRGQFLSQDPMFWQVGNAKVGRAMLNDPQSMNSYSYAGNNPIINKDPLGLWYKEFITGQQSWSSFSGEVGEAANYLGQSSSGWNFAMNHPYTSGALVAVGTYPALVSGGAGAAALRMATWPGVSAPFAAQHGFAALVYGALTADTTLAVPGFVNTLSQFDPKNSSSVFSAAWSVSTGPAASAAGGYVGAFADAYQFAGLLNKTLGTAATNLFSNSVQTRTSTVSSFNTAIGGNSGGGSGQPSNNSLWITPSGAVVNWGGQLVSPPPSK